MNVKVRTIEVDAETAELLEARAAARGVSVSELIADLAGNEDVLPADLAALRATGEGPWSPRGFGGRRPPARRIRTDPRRRAVGRGQGLDGDLGHAA